MAQKCENCGAGQNLQRHHKSYNPEVTQILCVPCHLEVHRHGVGCLNAKSRLLSVKDRFLQVWAERKSYEELAKLFGVSYITVYNWVRKLGLPKRGKSPGRPKGTISLSDMKVASAVVSPLLMYETVIKQGDRLLISVQKKHYPKIQGLKGKLCKITIEPLEGE